MVPRADQGSHTDERRFITSGLTPTARHNGGNGGNGERPALAGWFFVLIGVSRVDEGRFITSGLTPTARHLEGWNSFKRYCTIWFTSFTQLVAR